MGEMLQACTMVLFVKGSFQTKELVDNLDQQRLWKEEGTCTGSVVIDRPENYSYLLKIMGSWRPCF